MVLWCYVILRNVKEVVQLIFFCIEYYNCINIIEIGVVSIYMKILQFVSIYHKWMNSFFFCSRIWNWVQKFWALYLLCTSWQRSTQDLTSKPMSIQSSTYLINIKPRQHIIYPPHTFTHTISKSITLLQPNVKYLWCIIDWTDCMRVVIYLFN